MLLRLQNSIQSMSSLIHEQERVANNLANANTIGYKRDRTFVEALGEHLDAEGAPRSDRSSTQWASMDQGALESTGNPLDLAIKGEGFFVLSSEDTGDLRYTRAGRFTLDSQGLLRDPLGFQVEGDSGPLQFPALVENIEVAEDGTVRADGNAIGRIRLVRFEDAMSLQRLDNAAFTVPGSEPVDVEHPTMIQGHLETSNVNPLSEMSEMITHFRLFETQQKLLQSTDQILGSVTRELGKF
ncbi:MAG TPA: flagellar basal-body rod protein FlgF [Rhodothermales bacterium]|nr:flagellar basal-body rod protein FlgF [Rhodothermales bacterium]